MPPRSLSAFKIARTSAILFIPRLICPGNLTNALVRFSVWFDAPAHRSQCTETTRLPCSPRRSAGLRNTADTAVSLAPSQPLALHC
ncbi:hypothetical protein VTO73DRAFT_5883 [Trametes versicolor]